MSGPSINSATKQVPALLGIFAKHWEPGKVKTRLARTVGESHAAMLHGVFVATLLKRFAAVADQRVVAFAPANSEPAFATLAGGAFALWPQITGDLGQRIQAFFTRALAAAERVVLIGSDSPDLPAGYLTQAFDALVSRDVVLGPATDGGYYLIGLARRLPPIFTGIDWSTADVWTQTTGRLTSAGIAWHELPPWYDVDEWADLQALANRLPAGPSDPVIANLGWELKRLQAGIKPRPPAPAAKS